MDLTAHRNALNDQTIASEIIPHVMYLGYCIFGSALLMFISLFFYKKARITADLEMGDSQLSERTLNPSGLDSGFGMQVATTGGQPDEDEHKIHSTKSGVNSDKMATIDPAR